MTLGVTGTVPDSDDSDDSTGPVRPAAAAAAGKAVGLGLRGSVRGPTQTRSPANIRVK
jgi:hypothetical protein